jgi:hypothetical protein
MNESPSIEAITLAKAAFSSVQGQLGLIKFTIEELVPADGTESADSRIWNLTCSFYENLGSPSPTKYQARIILSDKTVTIKKIGGGEPERKFTMTEEGVGAETPGKTNSQDNLNPPSA